MMKYIYVNKRNEKDVKKLALSNESLWVTQEKS